MLSQIREYSCQYTGQIRKKHKSWHDGKLRYYEANNRFQLFDEEGKQLSSQFITNKRYLADILNEEDFGNKEHRIFGSYIVIISELINQFERDEANVGCPSVVKSEFPASKELPPTQEMAHCKEGGIKGRNGKLINTIPSLKEPNNLALRSNKPFKPPRLLQKPDQQKNKMKKGVVKKEVEAGFLTQGSTSNCRSSNFLSSQNIAADVQKTSHSLESNTLDPVEYMKQTNSILRTGRLCKKNYIIKNSPINL